MLSRSVARVTAAASVRRRVGRLRDQLDVPFVRNAYSLVGSTLATSGFGVIFWIVAARLFTKEEVGRDTALISTMLFLSSISQLNLTNGFNRFVPVAGVRTRRLVVIGYLATMATACIASSVFVLGINLWAPRLSLLHDHWAYAIWFVLGTVVWTVFALQDAVLTGLGEAQWVFVENVLYGIVKIGLLFFVAASLPALGVYAAWTLPLIVAVIAVNGLIFKRVVPQRANEPLEAVDARVVRHYVGFDMVATLTLSATIGLMPVIMLSILGPSASAYLYLSWTIAYALYLVSIGVGMSFITETSKSPERIVEYARKTIKHSLRIVAPLALLIAISAPLVLRIYGPAYSHHATRLLQLLALSAIPNAVTLTYLNITRVQRRMKAVITTTAALAAGVLVIAISLAPIIGIAAVGVGWFVSQCAVAAVLLLGELRTVWLPYVHTGRFGFVTSHRAARDLRSRRDATAEGGEALHVAGLAPADWEPLASEQNPDGIRTVRLRNRHFGDEAVLKVATSARAEDALRRDVVGLQHARGVAPPELAAVLPQPVGLEAERAGWTLERWGPGVSGRTVVGDDRVRAGLTGALATLATGLHRATATTVTIGDELPELLGLPLAVTDVLPSSRLRLRADESSLAKLHAELRADLVGSTVTAAFVHGNLWLGSAVCDPGDGRVTALVGWERSRVDMPVLELVHLVCTTRAVVERRELGAVVRDVLTAGAFEGHEAELISAAAGADELSTRTAVLLMWLRHVHAYTRHAADDRPSDVWVSHNVHQVLESV
ncbi:MAG TPA: phosphotransferase [Acidimicrobiia bacterium]